ncbi:MAG: serine hydrolase domain-containing protein [Balneolaceae bacterium]
MKITTYCLYLGCLTLILGCESYGTKISTPEISQYSKAYKAPEFSDSSRFQNIKNSLPQIDEVFKNHAASNNYPGFSYGIVVDDSLIFTGSTGTVKMGSDIKVTNQSLFKIASLTKSFTAMAILKLRDEGKLALTDPVSQYVSELEDLEYLTQDAPVITIFNLLTMTSGFPEDNPWADQQLESTSEEFSQLLESGFSFSSTPSLNYEYSNLGYALLGEVISNLAGTSYQQYITEEIFHALEMRDTHWEFSGLPEDKLVIGYRWEDEKWKEEPMLHDGAFGAIGGIITSLEDYGKYVAFHLSAWPASNKPQKGPIKRSSIREMHTIHSPIRLYANAKDADGNLCPAISGYGYGLGIFEDCNGVKRVSHSGGLPGYGTEYRFYPEYGVGIISFASKTYAPAGRVNNEVFHTLKEVAKLKPRETQVSEILQMRKYQVAELIKTWDETLSSAITADNLYKDKPQSLRMREAKNLLATAGEITSTSRINPQNQLRGTFTLYGTNADIEIFFSLSPEANPKVQRINLRLIEKDEK